MVVDDGCKLRLRFVVDDRVILWFIRLWVVIDWLLFYLLNNKIKKGMDVLNEKGNIISKYFFFWENIKKFLISYKRYCIVKYMFS